MVDLVKALRSARKGGQLQELSDRDRSLIDERILVSSWYPLEDFLRLLELTHQKVMGGSLGAAEMMGEFGAEAALSGVHKAFVRQGDPQGTARAIETIWPMYFDFGTCRAEQEGEELRIVVTGYPDMPRAHGHLLLGWIRKAVQLAGGASMSLAIERAPWEGDDEFVVAVRVED